jgi:hypothetical protein
VPTDEGFVVQVGTAAASVNDDGSVASTNAGIQVTRPSTGVYCIAITPSIDPTYAVATPRSDDSTDAVEVDVLPAAPDCPSQRAEVNTYQMTFGSAAAAPAATTASGATPAAKTAHSLIAK